MKCDKCGDDDKGTGDCAHVCGPVKVKLVEEFDRFEEHMAEEISSQDSKIQQFAAQADEYSEQTIHYYNGQFEGLTWKAKIKHVRDTKFAELIVRECAGVTLDYKNDEHYAGWVDHAAEILKHFGVEE